MCDVVVCLGDVLFFSLLFYFVYDMWLVRNSEGFRFFFCCCWVKCWFVRMGWILFGMVVLVGVGGVDV